MFTNSFKIWKGMKVKELMQAWTRTGFASRQLGRAYEIYRKMLNDRDCIKILSVAGSLVPAGMRNVFVKALKAKLADVCVFTVGSTLDHDLIEAFGIKHKQGDPYADDKQLAKKHINRIYDVYLPNEGYLRLEKGLRKIFPKLPQKELSSREFLYELGKRIEDRSSIIRNAADLKIPIFDPGIVDSITGFHAWIYSQMHDLKLNPQLDVGEFLELVWKKRKRIGLVTLGGGLPKHFVAAMAQVTGKSISYGIQITTSRPEHGGVSGAPLREAKSWRKLSANALTADVICDATIAWPLLVAALL